MSYEDIKKYQFTSETAREAGKKSKRGPSITDHLNKIIKKEIDVTDPIDGEKGKKQIGEAIALTMTASALGGDSVSQKEILDRTEGKAIQTIKQTNTFQMESKEDAIKQLQEIADSKGIPLAELCEDEGIELDE